MAWFRRIFGAYEASNPTHKRPSKAGTVSFAQDEDRAVTEYGRERVRLECTDLRRNNGLACGLIGRFCDNVVGPGILPQAKTSDKEWNDKAERFFCEWCKISDYRQRSSMWDMQRMAVEAGLIGGEIGFMLVKNGQLQPVEAERIRTPNKYQRDPLVVDGIRVTASGIKTGYYVHNRDKDGRFSGTDYQFVPAENFKHIARTFRPDQIRGIPALAPAVNSIKDFDDYVESILTKARNEAKAFYIVKNQGGAPNMTAQPRRYEKDDEGTRRPIEKIETGDIHYMRTNEDMAYIESKTPGTNFSPFTERVARIIGAALGLPYEFVLLDFSQGSFSSSRAALLQTYRTFNNWQYWLINGFLQPVWNWRIAKAINDGQLPPAPVDPTTGISEWYKVQWQTPEFGWVDPQNEAQGHIMTINAGAGTISEWCRKRGRDAEDVLSEKTRDIEMAIELTDALKAKFPEANISWRDLIVTNLPGQFSRRDADEASKKPTEKGGKDDDETKE